MSNGARAAVRTAAGVLSLVAGVVHVVVAWQHVGFAVDLAMFGLVGVAQVVWGVVVLAAARPARGLLWGGVALQLTCSAAWGMSRLTGLPVGHHAGEAQSVGFLDTTVVASQLGATAAAAALATGVTLGRLAAVGALGLAVALPATAGVALAADPGHDRDRDHEHEHDHDDHEHDHDHEPEHEPEHEHEHEHEH